MLLDIEKFIYDNLQISVDRFKASVVLEGKYYYESRRTCVYGFRQYEDFLA